MTKMLNRCEFIGNLGRDPEIRRTTDGTPVVNFTIAVSERWRSRDSGEMKDKTEWVRIVIWNEKLGEVAQKYLRKGAKIFVSGQLQTRKWTDQSGADKYSTEVVLQRFRGELQLLDKKGEDGAQSGGTEDGNSGNDGVFGGGPDLDDSIPFAPQVD